MAAGNEKLQEKLALISNKPLVLDDHLADVLDTLENVTASWYEIGVRLHIPVSRLADIKADNPSDVKQSMIEVLTEWLKGNYNTDKWKEPTWRRLAQAVANINGIVFKKIADEHNVDSTVHVTPAAQSSATPTLTSESPPQTEETSHPALFQKPTPRTLLVLKYKDSSGETVFVRSEEIVASKWREMGSCFGFADGKLNIWDTQYSNDGKRAHAVLTHWLANGSEHYPTNWLGFIRLLCEDLQLADNAKEIRTAVIANYKIEKK